MLTFQHYHGVFVGQFSYYTEIIRREALMALYRRRTNEPYLSGDVFASIVDHAAFGRDGNSKLDRVKAGNAKSLFVVADRLEELVQICRDYAWTPRVLITGNSDRNFTRLPEGIPSSLRLWLCQNSAISGLHHFGADETNLEIMTLPIGLENISLGRAGRPKWFRRRIQDKYRKVLVPPMSMSNPQRLDLQSKFCKLAGTVDYFDKYLPINQYMDLARRYLFVVCIEGNGYENHRIWETLYHGAFPVMTSTKWSQSLRDLGYPILLVDQLQDLTEEDLQNHAAEHHGFDPDKLEILWIDYWRGLVRSFEEL